MSAVVKITFTCCECGDTCTETWDDRCQSCWYVYSGGDLGRDEWVWKHQWVTNDATVYVDFPSLRDAA